MIIDILGHFLYTPLYISLRKRGISNTSLERIRSPRVQNWQIQENAIDPN